ncbi:hypothetical protein BpHYR1_049912 [Brachionus plicatilis]|uniref:Uncharacterized protein n=1 Tax=Brachionus plicatilis TaxID=10195 RepID=A0A3M7SJI1_BRAPC|nr:hypothetical protein BpHYR1_049912 [Brachionus plicatilis]
MMQMCQGERLLLCLNWRSNSASDQLFCTLVLNKSNNNSSSSLANYGLLLCICLSVTIPDILKSFGQSMDSSFCEDSKDIKFIWPVSGTWTLSISMDSSFFQHLTVLRITPGNYDQNKKYCNCLILNEQVKVRNY